MKSALISLAFFLAAAGSVGGAGSGAAIAAAASSAAVGPDATAIAEARPLPTATGTTGGAPLGWNFFHALYFIDTNGNQWTYVFSKETPSDSFFTENIPDWADAFRSACPNGSLIGIHVTNSTNGTFDQVAVYGPGF